MQVTVKEALDSAGVPGPATSQAKSRFGGAKEASARNSNELLRQYKNQINDIYAQK